MCQRPQDTPQIARWSFYSLCKLDVPSDFYLKKGCWCWGGGGGGCTNSTAVRLNLQRFIDVQYVLVFAGFIAASSFVADRGPPVNEMWLLFGMTCIRVKLIISHKQIASSGVKNCIFITRAEMLPPVIFHHPTIHLQV